MAKVKIDFKLQKKDESRGLEKIMVWSAKGGVGKTTISIAIANKLSKNEKVGLVDADITCPNILDYLNIKENLVGDKEKNIIYPITKGNLEIISMGGITNKDIPWRGVMLSKAVEDFINRVSWKAKRLIIDSPPGTSDVLISLASTIDKAILITTPSKLALKDLERSINFLNRFNIKIVGIIENMVMKNSLKEKIEKETGIKVLCSIKHSEEINESIEKGETIDYLECFEEIIKEIIGN